MKELTDEQIREAEAQYYKNQPALGVGNSPFHDGAKWAMSQDQWVAVDPHMPKEVAEKISNTDGKLIQCLFDDESICSYSDETWPFAVLTHVCFLPSPPNKLVDHE